MSIKSYFYKTALPAISIALVTSLPLAPINSYAVNDHTLSKQFVQLLDNVIEQQAEQQTTQAIRGLASSNQELADSWIPSDIDIIIHHENDTLTDNLDYQNWQVGAEFSVWLPSQKLAQQKVSNSYRNKIPAQQGYLKWLASNTLRQLVWSYKKALIEAKAMQSALSKSRSLKDKIQLKVKAGDSPKIDLLLAKKSVLHQQNKVVLKQSNLTILQYNFQLRTQTTTLPTNINESLNNLIDLESHPRIIKLKADLQIEESALEQAKSFKYSSPKVYLGAQVNKDKAIRDNSLMIELSIPLGLNSGYSKTLAMQKSHIYEKQAILDKAKKQLAISIYKARQTLATAKLSIQFTKKQFELSKKAMDMSELAYELGESNIQNLLLVQQQGLDAKLEYELSKVQLGQSIANFNQISGHILGEE
jgi:outer membrane protein TolC